jgi:hypothetical protein
MAADTRIQIEVVVFRPVGSVTTTTVNMVLQNRAGATTPPTDGVVDMIGAYHIRTKRFAGATALDPTQPRNIKFWVIDNPTRPGPKDTYLPLGISFINRNQNNGSQNIGQHIFSNMQIAQETIQGVGKLHVLTVTNDRSHAAGESYDYLLVIQRLSDQAIGIIDPEWENE